MDTLMLAALPNCSVDASQMTLEAQPLPGDRVVSGAPAVGIAELISFGDISIGVWELSPSVSTDVEVDEVFVVLHGEAVVTFDDGSEPLVLRPGTVGRLAAGAKTTWHVTETLRKIYIA